MEYYKLGENESPLFKCDCSDELKIILTNLNFVFININKSLLHSDEAVVEVIPKEDVKFYNEKPQIKQQGSLVEMYFKHQEKSVTFNSRMDAYKFDILQMNFSQVTLWQKEVLLRLRMALILWMTL